MIHSALLGSVILESFPKLVVDVHCTVLESQGSVASCGIIGASIALSNAGIEMKDIVTAVTVVRVLDVYDIVYRLEIVIIVFWLWLCRRALEIHC